MMLSLIGGVQVCRACGEEFGTDGAVRCKVCHSYICPHCGKCNCLWAKAIFPQPQLSFS